MEAEFTLFPDLEVLQSETELIEMTDIPLSSHPPPRPKAEKPSRSCCLSIFQFFVSNNA